MNGSPQSIRKTIQLMILLTLLAWATQTLFHQWGYGAELPPVEAAQPASEEKFVAQDASQKFATGTPRSLAGATLELRGEATIVGGEVKLKQICRWADADKAAFEPVADLVVARISGSTPFRAMTLTELKATLQDAGVNLAVIHFAGTTNCTISRSDVVSDERANLQEWISARQGKSPTEAFKIEKASVVAPLTVDSKAAPTSANTGVAQPAVVVVAPKPRATNDRTLRDLLVADLAERLSLEATTLQMKFSPADEKLLNLAEPQFRFNVDGQRTHGLGSVSWDVTIVTDSGNTKTTINANARAWQDQLVVLKPIAYHQTFQSSDITDRRALVDSLNTEASMKREQVVGQMAGQELKAGTVLTPRVVEPSPLVKPGQPVTITLQQGGVKITSVARAMEGGSYGQTIRVKNETTGNVFEVTLSGPQAALMSANAPTEGTKTADASH